MPAPLPQGEPAPEDGLLPPTAREGAARRAFGVYLHVPFCRTRCGYCDFNTYTATELQGAKQEDYAAEAAREIRFAGRALRRSGVPGRLAQTVFFGGGTPTLLPSDHLARMLGTVREVWGIAPGAEITTESNPDSVDERYLAELAEAGFTRVSFGMQSAVPHVLKTLERTHDPARIPLVVRWARRAGLDVSLDLIYGTPGESLDDWRCSLDAALEQEPDHISAYSLIVEPGTKLARQVRRGLVPEPDDDLAADEYELADEVLGRAGFDWYEISNWARRAPGETGRAMAHRSRHNLAYWRDADWWGIGPGAHSHVGGVRWWNVKHPAAYAHRVQAGLSPAAGREVLDEATRTMEAIMVGVRIAEGFPVARLGEAARSEVPGLVAEGLLEPEEAARGMLVLTLRGRLLGDAVVRRLT
ncbi:MAG TPA: radical SAM family heme chaperone HemW [Microbacteriaceae bacterium]|nr:radical SAM family heme chaperone HemW [Microbacteriaceae bacterium]